MYDTTTLWILLLSHVHWSIFPIATIQKHPNCLPVDEWMKRKVKNISGDHEVAGDGRCRLQVIFSCLSVGITSFCITFTNTQNNMTTSTLEKMRRTCHMTGKLLFLEELMGQVLQHSWSGCCLGLLQHLPSFLRIKTPALDQDPALPMPTLWGSWQQFKCFGPCHPLSPHRRPDGGPGSWLWPVLTQQFWALREWTSRQKIPYCALSPPFK